MQIRAELLGFVALLNRVIAIGSFVTMSLIAGCAQAPTNEPHAERAQVSQNFSQTLRVKDIFTNPAGNHLLSYLIQCALPASDSLSITLADGKNQTFDGGLGFAPNWKQKPLTETEERWVTACLLARLNYFGKTVVISIRASQARFGQIPEDVRREYAFNEGTFYGNIFQEPPNLFACRSADATMHSSSRDLRVCTDTASPTDTLTRCGIALTGACEEVCKSHNLTDGSYSQCRGGRQSYDETATVYLKTD